MPVRHLANSGGVLHFSGTHLDMVRPGILLYGVLPDAASRPAVPVRPALSLVSQVVYFKVVRAGGTVSYGATWTAPADTRVVTVPIGYGDGWPRALSSHGQVLVRGERHRVVGRVCMDQFMVAIGASSACNRARCAIGRRATGRSGRGVRRRRRYHSLRWSLQQRTRAYVGADASASDATCPPDTGSRMANALVWFRNDLKLADQRAGAALAGRCRSASTSRPEEERLGPSLGHGGTIPQPDAFARARLRLAKVAPASR